MILKNISHRLFAIIMQRPKQNIDKIQNWFWGLIACREDKALARLAAQREEASQKIYTHNVAWRTASKNDRA